MVSTEIIGKGGIYVYYDILKIKKFFKISPTDNYCNGIKPYFPFADEKIKNNIIIKNYYDIS